MNNSLLKLFAVPLLCTVSLAAQANTMIPPEHAVRSIGQDGMVCGKVERARYAESSEGKPTFLHMGGTFPRHTFSARIPGSARDSFGFAPETLQGKTVCVLGKIQRDATRAEIVVTSPASIKLADIK